jgi:3-oxoacyl-[acyl-carrier protein] reductase
MDHSQLITVSDARSATFTGRNMTAAAPLPDTGRRPVVLITGVEQREGAHIARVLHAMGYHVVAHSFSAECAENVALDLDDTRQRVSPVAADLTIESDVDRLFAEVEHYYGGVDALVHAAWIPGPESASAALAEIHPHDWARFTNAHTTMLLLTTRRAVTSFGRTQRCGRIVVVTGLGRNATAEASGTRPLARRTIDGAVEAFAVAAAKQGDSDGPAIYVLRFEASETAQTFGVQILELLGSVTPPETGRVLPARALRRSGQDAAPGFS